MSCAFCKALLSTLGVRDDMGMIQQLDGIPEPGQSDEASPT